MDRTRAAEQLLLEADELESAVTSAFTPEQANDVMREVAGLRKAAELLLAGDGAGVPLVGLAAVLH